MPRQLAGRPMSSRSARQDHSPVVLEADQGRLLGGGQPTSRRWRGGPPTGDRCPAPTGTGSGTGVSPGTLSKNSASGQPISFRIVRMTSGSS